MRGELPGQAAQPTVQVGWGLRPGLGCLVALFFATACLVCNSLLALLACLVVLLVLLANAPDAKLAPPQLDLQTPQFNDPSAGLALLKL